MPAQRSQWNEATRVQMPALVHLTRIGYTYFGKITEDMAGSVYDPDTNILVKVFKEQFAKLNPDRAGEAESKYMAFLLRSKYFRKVINSNTIMTLRASFNEDIFSFLTLYLPDYEEQVKIGDMLYNVERKISVNKKINDNLAA